MEPSPKVLELLELLGLQDEAKIAFGSVVKDLVLERKSNIQKVRAARGSVAKLEALGAAGSTREITKDMIAKAVNEAIASYTKKVGLIYEEHFSEKQLDELIAFFRTPIGTMYVAKHKQMESVLIDITAQEAHRLEKALIK